MSKEKEEENMWDIVDLDDEAIEEYASNELLGQFLSNTVFRTGILCVILFNSILIAVETDQELVSTMYCGINWSSPHGGSARARKGTSFTSLKLKEVPLSLCFSNKPLL